MPARTENMFEYAIDVAAAYIDELGHVNNAIYLKWVQAAVLRHWRGVAPQEAVASYLWVASRHDIRYRNPAFPDDHVVVRVALQKLSGARAFYKTVIQRGDQVLAEVDSCWACISAATKKPVRLAEIIAERFLMPRTQG
ncbi:MAG TPA: thioesterase family protein [Paenirhodobacter sp.]